MLVLSRRRNQKILVTGPCVIEVCEVRGDLARIGIHAEDGTQIMREEVAMDTEYRPEMLRWKEWILARQIEAKQQAMDDLKAEQCRLEREARAAS